MPFSTKYFLPFAAEGINKHIEDAILNTLKVFKAMLHFVYRDALPEDDSVASGSCSPISETLTAKLLAAADKYDLGRLRRVCESRLCQDISVNSVSRALALADCYHATELKAVCLRFAAENLADMDYR